MGFVRAVQKLHGLHPPDPAETFGGSLNNGCTFQVTGMLLGSL